MTDLLDAPAGNGRTRSLGRPSLLAVCTTDGCLAQGVVRTVRLRNVGSFLYEMPRLLCGGCHNEVRTEIPMAKLTRHGGASYDHAPEPDVDEAPADQVDEPAEPTTDPEPPEPTTDNGAVSNADVRAWAAENDVEVNASGPIPKAVREAYAAAHEG